MISTHRFETLALFAILLSSPFASFAAEPDFAWSLRGGGKGEDKIRGMAQAKDGAIFVTGEIGGTADFGGQVLTTAGKLDCVVAKIAGNGRVLWAVRAGGTEIDRGYGISATGDGCCFVTGHFQSETIQFGSTELKNSGEYDTFVARFNAQGKCVWARRAGGANYDYGHGVSTDSEGNAIVAGAFSNRGTIGDNTYGIEKGRSAMLAKFSQDGKNRWVKTVSGRIASGHNVATSRDGSIYLCGYVRGEVAFTDKVSMNTSVREIFLAKYNSEGTFQWVQTAGGQSDGLATSVVVDDTTGNVCIAGMFQGTAKFGDQTFVSRGEYDFYMAVFSPVGDLMQAHRGGGAKIDYALGATAIPGGGFAVTGAITERGKFSDRELIGAGAYDAFVAVLESSGEVRSMTLAGGRNYDLSYAIAPSNDGVVIAGAFRKESHFGKHAINAKKGDDIFVAKLRLAPTPSVP